MDVAGLVKIYRDYKEEHEKYFDYYAASIIRDTLASYTAFNVMQQREALAKDMQEEVKLELKKYGVEVTALQLEQTVLPERFIEAIDETIITEQNQEKARNEYEKAITRGDTKVRSCE